MDKILYKISVELIDHIGDRIGYSNLSYLRERLERMDKHINDPVTLRKQLNGRYLIQEGNHRVEIFRRLFNKKYVPAYVTNPTDEEVIVWDDMKDLKDLV